MLPGQRYRFEQLLVRLPTASAASAGSRRCGRKCCARSRMSRAFRSGGSSMGTTSAASTGLRELPLLHPLSQGRGLVARSRGGRAGWASPRPPLDLVLLERAQDLRLQIQARSPISSRNRVPPFASSNLPASLVRAGERAPARGPKSSLSTRLAGMAGRLTATKGLVFPVASGRGCSGQHLLAGAALPRDQDGDGLCGDLFRHTCTPRASAGAAHHQGAPDVRRLHVVQPAPVRRRRGAGGARVLRTRRDQAPQERSSLVMYRGRPACIASTATAMSFSPEHMITPTSG